MIADKRLTKVAVCTAAILSLSACGLPRSGPNKAELLDASVVEGGQAYVVPVNDAVNAIASVDQTLGFPASFRNAAVVGSDTIRAGDVLGLTIYENVDDGLLAAPGQNAAILNEVQVDGSGFIFVPYAGRIRAAGNTPEAIRQVITTQLGEQTPDPQVEVRRVAGDGAAVSVVGAVTAQGVYPIERPTRTLSGMLARAGGTVVEPEITRVTLLRNGERGSIWFEDLYSQPGNNIALRNGDQIIVEQDTRNYTALGATGQQTLVPFEKQAISALEALAQVGGLSSNIANPTGVFILRQEHETIAERLVGADLPSDQRVVYIIDLTEPMGLFHARGFDIRDGDTVYVTEAPYTQFNKGVSALTGSLGAVRTVNQTATGLGG